MKKLFFSIFLCIILFLTGCSKSDDGFRIYAKVPDTVECIKDVEYGQVDNISLKMNILRPVQLPKGPMPVIVWIHGGGWEGGSKDEFLGELSGFVESGYLCASVEYRFSNVAKFPAQIEDCKAAVRYLRAHATEYDIDPDRIGVWGGSAGGHLAALMGASNGIPEFEGNGGNGDYSSEVQAACNWFGFVDIRSLITANDNPLTRLLGGPLQQNVELAAKASPIVYLSKDSAPMLIMLGNKDDAYGLMDKRNKLYCEGMSDLNIECSYKVIIGAGHGFGSLQEYRMVKEFFDKQLAVK